MSAGLLDQAGADHVHADHVDTPVLKAPSANVARRPASSPIWVHLLLFLLTLFTTTALGMRYMVNFNQGKPPLTSNEDIVPHLWIAGHLNLLPLGLPFSLTLLAILLAHEFAHYAACRYVGVRASLPYLLPAPTLSGTVGAVIRLRSRMRSRKALLLIGASGPIAGFLVAIVTTWIGLANSRPEPAVPTPSIVQFNPPLLLQIFHVLVQGTNHSLPDIYNIVPHPMVVASWVGVLITAVNLIPAGQLDGGHILYAISPKAHQIGTQITIGVLALLGTVYWIGWLLWAMLLMLPAMKHPNVPLDDEMKPWQVGVIAVCGMIFLLCFSLQPFANASLVAEFSRITWGR
ncbi:site-2 protease family protein [Terriglobus albidus]|uniref:site-2 protease family protein n=1 Tax=Terriglobus albidus TaxID=1592106 RepID=UPI0021E06020|nr:site-2 protease family protein [Terriglobus albidus]